MYHKCIPQLQIRIVREDGVLGLFRGGGPTVVRAMALNMGMLASNDQAKEMIEAAGFAKGGSVTVIGGSLIAGAPGGGGGGWWWGDGVHPWSYQVVLIINCVPLCVTLFVLGGGVAIQICHDP